MKLALSSCYIGKCKVDNRFVMTAANLGWCQNGYVTDEVIAFYRERARGRVGLIIVGAAGVDPKRVNQMGMMQIYDDCFIPPMKKLTKEVHKEGSKIFLQLMHAGAYARQSEHKGQAAVAPSEYFCNFTREMGKELSKEEIHQIISYFREGAIRAVRAGFDGVELIGSAGYLIAEFLSRATNHRTDEYGGSLENRTRFLLEIIEAIRSAVGEDYPIIVRLSGSDFIPNGNSPSEVIEIGRMLDEKVDAINVTGGWHESQVPQITYNVPHGMYLYLAKAMKDAVSVPVIGCNRLDIHKARYSIENGYSDMAGILRGLIAEPYLVKKYMEGRVKDIRPCLSCNQCLERIFSGVKLKCVVNPFVGKEAYGEPKRQKGQSILVIGAGISGMVYASLMADRNRVTIWEKSLNYGGSGNVVARIPNREEVENYLDYLFRRCIFQGVTFKWNKEGKRSEIKKLLERGRFDKVIIAAGSSLITSKYKIAGEAPVYLAEECILTNVPKGRNIVVLGSGYKAVQTAQYCVKAGKSGDEEQEFLSRYAPEYLKFANNIMNWGKNSVTLLSPDKKVGQGFGKSTRWMMLKDIKEMGVTIETEAKVKLIEKRQVIYTVGEEEKVIPSDMVIISEGWEKNHDFTAEMPEDILGTTPKTISKSDCTDQLAMLEKVEERKELVLESMEFAEKIQIIGDAKRPGRISEAVEDAYRAAMN